MSKPPADTHICSHSMGNEKDAVFECLYVFRTSYIILISLFLGALVLAVADEPPGFPLKADEEAVDCFNMRNARIWGEKSRIKVALELDDFVQYPKEVATSLLNIVVTQGNLSFKFPTNRFWDVESDLTKLSFCSLHTVSGRDANLSLYCQGHLLATNTTRINEISAYPVGWSRIFSNDDILADFKDVCFDSNKTFVFASQPHTSFSSFEPSLNYSVPVKRTEKSTESYRNGINAISVTTPSVFVAGTYTTATDIFLNVVIPLAAAVRVNSSVIKPRIVLMRPDKQQTMIPSIKPFTNEEITGKYEKKCYSSAIFPKSPGGVFPGEASMNTTQAIASHLEYAYRVVPNSTQQIRKLFSSSVSQKDLIVFDSHLAELASAIRPKVSKYQIEVLDENQTVPEIARRIASAKIYVSGHSGSKLFAVFLQSSAKFIELTSDVSKCETLGRDISKAVGGTHQVLSLSQCECCSSDFHLQWPAKAGPFDKSQIDGLLRVLK